MPQYDDEYMIRREKQIKETYELRAGTIATTIIAIAATIGVLATASQMSVLTVLFGLCAGVMGVGAVFMVVFGMAQVSAEKAIQKEYDRVLALREAVGEESEKPKRQPTVRLSDDGELVMEDEAAKSDGRNRARRTTSKS